MATTHHETSDVDIRAILGFGAGLLIAAIAIHLLVYLLFVYFSTREARRVAPAYPLAAAERNRLPPAPRLQPSPPDWKTPREDLQDLRAREDALLGSYGWIDSTAGVVRIPIDQAMKIVVQRGLPARQDKR